MRLPGLIGRRGARAPACQAPVDVNSRLPHKSLAGSPPSSSTWSSVDPILRRKRKKHSSRLLCLCFNLMRSSRAVTRLVSRSQAFETSTEPLIQSDMTLLFFCFIEDFFFVCTKSLEHFRHRLFFSPYATFLA